MSPVADFDLRQTVISNSTFGPNEIKQIRKDPWQNEYVYVKSGPDGYEVYSYGPDKVQGGGDDISSAAQTAGK